MYIYDAKSKYTARDFRVVLIVMIGTLCGATAALASPADTFKTKCAMCHGADGSGNTPLGKNFNIPDMRSAAVQKKSDSELSAIITNGKPPMPGFGKTLSAGDIQDLVSYLRSIARK